MRKVFYHKQSKKFGLLNESGQVVFDADENGNPVDWIGYVPSLVPVVTGLLDWIVNILFGSAEEREAARILRRDRRHMIRLKKLEIKLERAKKI